jgi:MFS family permease
LRCNEDVNTSPALASNDPLRRLLREPRRPRAVRASPRARWYVVATVCVGAFMGQLDASIVTLALPRIGGDLHAGTGAVRWVALSYMLVLTATLVPLGLLADRVGRKLLYTYGFAVFTAGSALCGVAPDLDWLVAARVLQGLGAAMLQANSIALIAASLSRRELAHGLGVQGAAQASGLALGPVLGGLLLALGGWRLVFLVNIPAGLLGLTLGWLLLPHSRLAAAPPAGGLLAAGRAHRCSHTAPRRARVRARVHARGGVAFVDPALARGLGGAAAAYLVMFGALYTLTYLLTARHVPIALAGLQVAALPLALGVAAPLAGRLAAGRTASTGAHRAKQLPAGGLGLAAVGLLVLATRHDVLAGRLVGLALAGTGLGAFIPLNNAAVMSAAPRERAGMLSGVLNTARSLATALGVALAGLLYTASGPTVALLALTTVALAASVATYRDR